MVICLIHWSPDTSSRGEEWNLPSVLLQIITPPGLPLKLNSIQTQTPLKVTHSKFLVDVSWCFNTVISTLLRLILTISFCYNVSHVPILRRGKWGKWIGLIVMWEGWVCVREGTGSTIQNSERSSLTNEFLISKRTNEKTKLTSREQREIPIVSPSTMKTINVNSRKVTWPLRPCDVSTLSLKVLQQLCGGVSPGSVVQSS
jgi:hypothetical protein